MSRKNLSISREWLTKIFFEVEERTGRTEREVVRGRKKARGNALSFRETKGAIEQNRGSDYGPV